MRLLILLIASNEVMDIVTQQICEGLPALASLLDPRNIRLALQGLKFLAATVDQPDIRERLASSGLVEATVNLLRTKDERLRAQALAFIAQVAGQGAYLWLSYAESRTLSSMSLFMQRAMGSFSSIPVAFEKWCHC